MKYVPWLLLLALGVALYVQAETAGRWKAEAQARRDSVQRAQTQREMWHQAYLGFRDSAIKRIGFLEEANAELEADAQVAAAETRAARGAFDSLLTNLPGPDSVIVTRFVNAIEGELEVCTNRLGNCEERVSLQAARADSAESQLTIWRAATDSALGLWREEQRRNAPTLWKRAKGFGLNVLAFSAGRASCSVF